MPAHTRVILALTWCLVQASATGIVMHGETIVTRFTEEQLPGVSVLNFTQPLDREQL